MYSKEFFEKSPLRFCYNLFCHFSCFFPNYYTEGLRVTGLKIQKKKPHTTCRFVLSIPLTPKEHLAVYTWKKDPSNFLNSKNVTRRSRKA